MGEGITGSYNLIYIYYQSPVSRKLTDGWVQVNKETQTYSFPWSHLQLNLLKKKSLREKEVQGTR